MAKTVQTFPLKLRQLPAEFSVRPETVQIQKMLTCHGVNIEWFVVHHIKCVVVRKWLVCEQKCD